MKGLFNKVENNKQTTPQVYGKGDRDCLIEETT